MALKRAESAKRMGKSKTIPSDVFDKMFSSYSKPSTSEGFDEILNVDNIDVLKSALDNEIIKESIRQVVRKELWNL